MPTAPLTQRGTSAYAMMSYLRHPVPVPFPFFCVVGSPAMLSSGFVVSIMTATLSHIEHDSVVFIVTSLLFPASRAGVDRRTVRRGERETFFARRPLFQFLAEGGMGYVDERPRALADGFPIQIGDAVFCDDIMDVAARRRDAGRGRERRDDARQGSVLCGRRERDDRLSPLAPRGAADEIELPAEAAVEIAPDRIGADLPGEIDLEGGIDRRHPVVFRDD